MNIGEDQDSSEITFVPLETDTPAPVEAPATPVETPVEEPVSV